LETESADDLISSEIVGQMVSDSLLNLDSIAFIRFVSVYRKFSKISDFKEIINQIPEADDGAIFCKLPKTSLF
jgi:transcriptional repressor NrdR